MLLAYNAFNNDNQVIIKDDLQDYITTYLGTYKSIIEPPSNLTEVERESFKFYNGYPYSAIGVISKSHGIAIQFIPKSRESYQLSETNKNIEDILFPIMPDDAPVTGPVAIAVNGGIVNATNIGLFNIGLSIGKNGTFIFDGVSIVSNAPIFRKGNIELKGILLDDELNIIAKGSNLKQDWSRKKAEQDAIDALFRELNSITIERSRLKGLGFIEINNLIEDYNQKEKKGVYNENQIEKLKDRQKITETASFYGFYPEIYSDLLNKTDNSSSLGYTMVFIDNISRLLFIFGGISLFIVILVNKIKYNIPISQSLKDQLDELLSIQKIGKHKN